MFVFSHSAGVFVLSCNACKPSSNSFWRIEFTSLWRLIGVMPANCSETTVTLKCDSFERTPAWPSCSPLWFACYSLSSFTTSTSGASSSAIFFSMDSPMGPYVARSGRGPRAAAEDRPARRAATQGAAASGASAVADMTLGGARGRLRAPLRPG